MPSKIPNAFHSKPGPKTDPLDWVFKFWARVDVRGANDCWEWKGAESGRGYGHMSLGGGTNYNNILVHRLSYVIHYGDISKNLVVRHKCNNKLCVNPKHLEAGTQLENKRDIIVSGRAKMIFDALDIDPMKVSDEDIAKVKALLKKEK